MYVCCSACKKLLEAESMAQTTLQLFPKAQA